MIEDLYIYRSCNRPEYVRHTLLENLNRTSLNGEFLIYDNSGEECRDEIQAEIEKARFEFGSRRKVNTGFSLEQIENTAVIVKAIRDWSLRTKEPRYVFVIDDDVLLPKPKGFLRWDDVLIEMLDHGWDVVAHPCDDSSREGKPVTVNGVKGYPYARVNAGCSGFKYDYYKEHPPEQTGYNEWIMKRNRGYNAYSHRGRMILEHTEKL